MARPAKSRGHRKRKIVLAALVPYHDVAEARALLAAIVERLQEACARVGIKLVHFWRDGPRDPGVPREQLVFQDAVRVAQAQAVLAFTGLPSKGVPMLLEVARINRVPVVEVPWPGASHGSTPLRGNRLLGKVSVTTGEEMASALVALLQRHRRLLERLTRKDQGGLERSKYDLRPARLTALMRHHGPLNIEIKAEDLASRTGIRVERIGLAMVVGWAVIAMTDREKQRIADELDVSRGTLDAESDREAGIDLRLHQLWAEAFMRNTPTKELQRVFRMILNRSTGSPLARVPDAVLREMFRKASRDQARYGDEPDFDAVDDGQSDGTEDQGDDAGDEEEAQDGP
jgi:hypothetical protein